jgi:hypothetical protein
VLAGMVFNQAVKLCIIIAKRNEFRIEAIITPEKKVILNKQKLSDQTVQMRDVSHLHTMEIMKGK